MDSPNDEQDETWTGRTISLLTESTYQTTGQTKEGRDQNHHAEEVFLGSVGLIQTTKPDRFIY